MLVFFCKLSRIVIFIKFNINKLIKLIKVKRSCVFQYSNIKVQIFVRHPDSAISGLSSRDVSNPYIVCGISVNKLIYGMTNQTLPPDSLHDGRSVTAVRVKGTGTTLNKNRYLSHVAYMSCMMYCMTSRQM